MEEFDEADVLWPDHPGDADRAGDRHQQQRGSSAIKPPGQTDAARRPACSSSAPMGIPVMIRPAATMYQGSWARRYHSDDGTASTFVAPHEMVARRRCASEEERSVCVGQGRTLKGRDLRSVRTAVLRMTGFLET
ncbi:hypothetical protein D1007_04725 [Hordeum vulgare]|nr:hypothetical protein D1007_04725 [Hordeum vulgare]KAI5019470.1 hypothetical protein ZWY2020_044358 [Hordeum vulgare]